MCISSWIKYICFSPQGDLVTCGVLSGNKNFEGRLCDCVRANYLASPPLVVAYAIAGTVNIDFQTEPLGVFSYILSVCLYVYCAYFLPELLKLDPWCERKHAALITSLHHHSSIVNAYLEVKTLSCTWHQFSILNLDIHPC